MLDFKIYKNRENFLLLNSVDLSKQIRLLTSWECLEGKYLKKRYQFSSYGEAKKFVDCVVDFAERVNHHPELLFGYKFVEVTIWTHNVGGLTHADFAYTQDMDDLYYKVCRT